MNRNQSGQSTVEYILLLATMMVLMLSFFRSDLISEFLSGEGEFFSTIRDTYQYTYSSGNFKEDNTGGHPVYGAGRHVISKEAYGQ